ncbi:choice-of-anchor B family protein [soil metagenome]
MPRYTFPVLMLAGTLLVNARPLAAQSFGSTAAVHADEVFFGAPATDATPGTVYVYRKDGGSWEEAGRLSASDGIPGDRFGNAMAVAGSRILIGAFWSDSGRGAAYVFEKDGASGAWSQTAKLMTGDRAPGDSLGIAVALEGDLALVAAASAADSGAGAVYAFRRDPGTGEWRAAGRLTADGVAPDARFGRSVALSGESAFVAAARSDSGTGSVYVFRAADQSWSQPTILTGTAPGELFGAAVATAGERLLIGAPVLGQGQGVVLIYRHDEESGEWRLAGRILPPAQAAAEESEGEEASGEPERSRPLLFGSTLALAGDQVWIGAPGADRFRGAVYSLEVDSDSGEWADPVRITPPDLERGDFFAGAIGLGDEVAAVGMPGDDYGAGTAAIFERAAGDWRFATRVMSEVQGLAAVLGEPVSCADGEAGTFDCRQVDMVAFLPVQAIGGGRGVELNDIWGWTDPETGKEFALVGRVDGTSFVDISDPVNPLYVGDLPKTATSPGSTWRDIKVYEDHAFIVADGAGEHGMQVFNLRRLRSVANAPATFTEDAHYDRIHSAHNIAINTDTGFAYTVGNSDGGETCGGGLHMIDIHDPLNPMFAGCFSDPSTGRQKTGYSHDAQCVLYKGPDEEYKDREICFGSNETALSVADVTDKENPVAVAMAEYPNVGYTHQAWLTEDHRYLLMDDELDELNGLVEHTRTLIWDVSDLEDPILIHEYFNPNTTAIDHNLYIKGDKVYQSNYVSGLRILDISDIENPVEVGFFDTVPYGSNGPRFDGSWSNYPYFESGVIVVTSGDEGLFLLRFRPAEDRPVS